jgi:hypothetical protein
MPDGLSREQTTTINTLVRDGQYDAARSLLTKWNAKDSLKILNAKHPPEAVKPVVAAKPSKPAQPAPPPQAAQKQGRSTYERVRNFALFVLLIVLVIGAIAMQQQWQNDYDAATRMLGH